MQDETRCGVQSFVADVAFEVFGPLVIHEDAIVVELTVAVPVCVYILWIVRVIYWIYWIILVNVKRCYFTSTTTASLFADRCSFYVDSENPRF